MGPDEVSVEIMKKGGKTVREWLVKVCNRCYQNKKVPDYWKIGKQPALYRYTRGKEANLTLRIIGALVC